MAVGYKLIGKNKLIPRPTYQGRHREYVKVDNDDPFENGGIQMVYTPFDVVECVVQPMTGKAARDYTSQLMLEGGKQYDSFTVYSSIPLRGPIEGSKDLADQILLPSTTGQMTWFTVIKADPYPSSGVARFRSFVVAVPSGTEGGI